MLLKGGDKVNVSVDTLGGDLKIEGSEESVKLAEIEAKVHQFTAKFDSLSYELVSAVEANESEKVAYLIEKGVSGQRLCDIIAKAQEARAEGKQVLVARMNKNKKFQKEQLMSEGYENFEEFYKEALK